MKKCRICAENIQPEALKCRYCNTWQNKAGGHSGHTECFGLSVILIGLIMFIHALPQSEINSFEHSILAFVFSLPFVFMLLPLALKKIWNSAIAPKFNLPEINIQFAIVLIAFSSLLL